MQKLNILENESVIMILTKAEQAIIQKALFTLRTELNNVHANTVAFLQSDTLSEKDHDTHNHLLTMVEDELNLINTISEIQF